ncbi:hypothetical protein ACFOKI_15830 [Sphingomonas qilianensis]|uniref:Uncharacterized protein n=1 Tax=Sphingomonas qilianensis TaxID=1736690 RepID=A0ABU9XWF0_9SPHN
MALPLSSHLCYLKISMVSNSDNTNKRGRPVTTGKGSLIGIRMLPDLLAALDEWIEAQVEPKPSRPEAARRILWEALSRR